MPNWVTNRLTIKADNKTLKRIIANVKSDDIPFDFNKIIPIPGNIYLGPLGDKERRLYGRNNWYDWCRDNWGTKWNACHGETAAILGDMIRYVFDTAWCAPYPVIQMLSFRYKCECRLEYYDEDFGYNCGVYSCVQGKAVTQICFDGGDDAYRWLAETFGEETMHRHGYRLHGDKWEYEPEDEGDD